MIGLLGIVLALLLLMYLAYRGVSVLILAPILALLAVLMSGNVPVLASYTQVFMPAMGHFILLYFPLFLLGALFGKLMDDSGAALKVAHAIISTVGMNRAILAVVIACAILTYGGVSLFVVAFAIYPIASALFRQVNIPKRLIPATIALGAFTFTMTALPGTPAIQNAIPMPYFGTTPFAAPFLGIIAALIMFVCGQCWLQVQAKKAHATNEGYEEKTGINPAMPAKLRQTTQGEGFDVAEITLNEKTQKKQLPTFVLAVLPIVTVIFFNYLFSAQIFPRINTDYLAQAAYGSTTIETLKGIWSIICALVVSILLLIVSNFHRLDNLFATLDSGANASVLPIFNTASLVGFGAVVASLPAFAIIQSGVESLGGNPLVSLAVSVNLLAGVTGSASGGMSIALQTLGDSYLAMAKSAGLSTELLHRITTVATGGLDSLPHNGAVVSLLSICGLTHRQSYKDVFLVAVVFPIFALIVIVWLGSVFGAF